MRIHEPARRNPGDHGEDEDEGESSVHDCPVPASPRPGRTGSRDASAARFRSSNAVDKRILLRHGGRGPNRLVGISTAAASKQGRATIDRKSVGWGKRGGERWRLGGGH